MTKWHGGASDWGNADVGTTPFPVIFDGEGNRVCNVDSWPEGNAEGNYERILLCVNAHDALVAALERLVSYGDMFRYRIEEGNPYEQAVAALAAAKEEVST